MLVAQDEHHEGLSIMLAHGAEVIDQDGCTALMVTTHECHILLANGAEVNKARDVSASIACR